MRKSDLDIPARNTELPGQIGETAWRPPERVQKVLAVHTRYLTCPSSDQNSPDECARLGFVAVVVLGHAEYYPRFGFVPASTFGLSSEFDVPDDVFMALELQPGTLGTCRGVIRYHPAFGSV